jgi:hypothetical protein
MLRKAINRTMKKNRFKLKIKGKKVNFNMIIGEEEK